MLLATGRVCLRAISLRRAVGSYPTLFTLTLHAQGGIVSVVLSLSLRTVAVSDYPALCCPDFPLIKSGRLLGSYELYHLLSISSIAELAAESARAF